MCVKQFEQAHSELYPSSIGRWISCLFEDAILRTPLEDAILKSPQTSYVLRNVLKRGKQ